MRVLLIFFGLTFWSCAMLEGAKGLITGSYEAGKIRGRLEILESIDENKKKLEIVEAIMLQEIITVIETKDYDQFKRSLVQLSAELVPLTVEKTQLKKELEASERKEKEDAIDGTE